MSSWDLQNVIILEPLVPTTQTWDGSAYSKAGTWTTSLEFVDSNGLTGTHTFATTIANSNPTVVHHL